MGRYTGIHHLAMATNTIAFFEWPQVRPVEEKDHGFPVKGPFVFDHVSIGVEHKEQLWEIKQILEASGYWVSEVIVDPNGIAIEFSWAVEEFDPRKKPRLLDVSPSALAKEGPDPQIARRPGVSSLPETECVVYPGERDQFENRKNHWENLNDRS